MNDQDFKPRRSTRLTIGIPIAISGIGVDGATFQESVQTLVVNKHGGLIAMTHRPALGSVMIIVNPAMGAAAETIVVWWGAKPQGAHPLHVGLRLIQPQNIWGISFPPEDWYSPEYTEGPSAANDRPNTR